MARTIVHPSVRCVFGPVDFVADSTFTMLIDDY